MSRILRFMLLALCGCMGLLPALAACNSSATLGGPPAPPTQSATGPAVAVTATVPPRVVTATAAPDEAFRLELGALTTLRGSFSGGGPGGEIEPLADVTIVHVSVQLASPSLADTQWDAFVIQQALWTGPDFTIPAGWEVSAQIFVPSADPNQSMGLEIGVANLHTASAQQFRWAQLSPQQAWANYDGTEYSPTGL
jgi:hypothetical protein